MNVRSTIAVTLCLALAATLGCNVTTGETGTLRFSYIAPTDLSGRAPLSRGIAVDTTVWLHVMSGDTDATVTGAESGDPAVVDVLEVDGPRIRLAARRAGEARLSITTDLGRDTVRVEAAAVMRTSLRPAIFEATGDAVLVGGSQALDIQRRGADGPLVGEARPEVAVEPTGAATIDWDAERPHQLTARYTETGSLTLRPSGGAGLDREVVSLDAIAALEVNAPGSPSPMDAPVRLSTEAEHALFFFVDDVDGRPLGALDGILTAESSTPEVCRFEGGTRASGAVAVLRSTASPGKCTVRIAVGDLERILSYDVR